MLKDYVKEELIFLNLTVSNRAELFKKLSTLFLDKGYVNEGFYDFIVEREENYPTGLDLETHTVAIPHGDPEYIEQSFISVVTLTRPIKMKKMENADEEIDVDLFFVLGLNDGTQHLQILKQIIGYIQQEKFVQSMKEAKTSEEVMEKLSGLLAGKK
ncbi:PTS sugar transporter subunit IIA [Enterococcus hulanensis]|uniref:PTS sugar transporter subunit IIA n=1 Tax=Enterococcus hulanensis TaxID=2559929 RepID=A0ABU3EU11_9ENTE|nr:MULTISPECIES: PTS sugar transporter subunit IIA [Enterococcus]MBX8936758.1 PTS sugar transporter subunit IIA [Enterococcus gilvus]MDT2598328.1 PTS sugar transporter subunit IIA [Enterococcus hulanensis]MDT2608167.1 PTS sugar transporter subunit IIA [Enterococcus hulanensis]MDT2615462.1 PTS sugar transporter subunit IIA [Enterococcus hulanensis]MDT2626567.1 PTS sugar transporter subunit IIA [Enterococcus hulanensis]